MRRKVTISYLEAIVMAVMVMVGAVAVAVVANPLTMLEVLVVEKVMMGL
jgi:hypothetical protein